ncbi:mobile mystery protein B [Leeuwenhoekiella marinoflava]|uniref:Fic-DOC domain mobile mystery protein B n=2 Tax=Leeuwenhoekiella marinoflava TaxID=988 RepID=A0A4Q0PKT9_9FLAO|nr:mobile mystery protein B [Leeuwenhoekiella marinoflava]RXG29013.1 Fic-DOC domain mobile mystery protein B [Leeuwenhoekiella marinoflava]SHF45480.1 mobile mystery protein B [Leeuwenhoekiella marinoflava DSM 3653]
MGLNLEYIDGQTPIDEEEKEGLRIETISTKEELDEFEQLNIEEALQWVFGKKFKANQVFTEKFICDLHKRMYGNVWDWTGQFRKTEKNIGIDKHQIPMHLKMLCDDALFWVENETFAPEELAIRFKHRLVSIHCFSNGNGRHSRLMGDIIIEKLFGEEPFSWGAGNLSKANDTRASYLKAVKQADLNKYKALLEFCRS